jgi:hypothetical protein
VPSRHWRSAACVAAQGVGVVVGVVDVVGDRRVASTRNEEAAHSAAPQGRRSISPVAMAISISASSSSASRHLGAVTAARRSVANVPTDRRAAISALGVMGSGHARG